jgi:hypothetical protein
MVLLSRGLRFIGRMVTLLALLVVLVGVPVAVVVLVGIPVPTWPQVHRAWSLHRLDAALVVRLGGVIFVVLWSWFAATALLECWRVLEHRRTGRPLRPTTHGPAGLLRNAIRFVVLSSATASLVGAVGAHSISANSVRPTTRHVVALDAVAPTRFGDDGAGGEAFTFVRRGVAQREALAASADVTGVGPVGPRSSLVEPASDSSPLVSYLAGMGTSLLLSAGVVGAVEVRRRRQWRASGPSSMVARRDPTQVHVEMVARSVHGDEALARLDVALRSVARDLARQRSRVVAVAQGVDGCIRIVVDGSASPSDSAWRVDAMTGEWMLPADLSLEYLAESGGDVTTPCPALVQLGVGDEGQRIFVDLEAVGMLRVRTPFVDDVLRSVAASLAYSPFMQGAHLVTVGNDLLPFEGSSTTIASVTSTPTLADAEELAGELLGSTAVASRGTSTFALRVLGSAGESWDPVIVVASGVAGAEAACTTVVGGRAVVIDAAGDGASDAWTLVWLGDRHMLEPLGWPILPSGIGHHDLVDVIELVDDADRVLPLRAQLPPPSGFPAPIGDPTPVLARARTPEATVSVPFSEPDWSLMVRVLGPVDVVTRDGVLAEFERSKSLELVVWLALHRERPTRSAARAALWDLDVRSSTFANVVSDARRGLARAAIPTQGDEWIARTLTDDLPLHAGVVTDAELLALRLQHARCLPHVEAVTILRPGVELVRAMVLSSTSYLWSDAEGHASALVVLAMASAIELAERYLALGDIDGVFWATGQGLRVLSGHEELIALRMRAHARKGDLSGVRNEWASYERALAADTWAAADPAPKLVALRRELLGGR